MILDSARFEPPRVGHQEISRLQDEVNRLFTRAYEPTRGTFPHINLWVSPESAVVTAEIPGMAAGDLNISVVGDTLTIQGSRRAQELSEGETYHRRERGSGRFVRTLQLPFRAEPDEVTATYRNGILNVTIPRAQADRPRKVQIKNQ